MSETTAIDTMTSTTPASQGRTHGKNLSIHLPMSDIAAQSMKFRPSDSSSLQEGEKDGERNVPASMAVPMTGYQAESPTYQQNAGLNLPSHHPSASAPPISNWITNAEIAKMGNLPYLSGMRAVASIFIQAYHFCKPNARGINFFAPAALSTHFVQGGFLITGSLLYLQAANRGKPMNQQHSHVPRFFIGRWVRLYPALVLMIFCNAFWWQNRHHNAPHLAKAIIRALFKIQHTSILDIPLTPSNPYANTWFLDVQEAFYLFWALSLPYIAMVGPKSRTVILVALFIYSFRIRLTVDLFNATLPINLWKMVAGAALQLIPIPRAFIQQHARTVATVTVAAIVVWGSSNFCNDNFTYAQMRLQGDIAGVIMVVVVTLAAMSKPDAKPNAAAAPAASYHARTKTVSDLSSFLPAGLIPPDFTPLSILNTKSLDFIGRVSYSWYLWQVPILHYEGAFNSGYRGLGSTAEAFIIAMCSTFWVEEPIRNLYQASRKRAKVAAAMAKEASAK